jgi:hypothetical protein
MRRRDAAGRGSAASARPSDDTGGRRGARSTPPLTCFWANRRWICVRRQRAGGRGGDGSARMDEEALDLRWTVTPTSRPGASSSRTTTRRSNPPLRLAGSALLRPLQLLRHHPRGTSPACNRFAPLRSFPSLIP